MKNLLIVLEALAKGKKFIHEDERGNYVRKSRSSVERDIESRLIFELYGEYPLGPANQENYNKIRPLFFDDKKIIKAFRAGASLAFLPYAVAREDVDLALDQYVQL